MTDKKQKDIPTVAEKTDRWVIEPEQFDFVLNKVSKISTVLYKLSDSLSDNEPLKWHLRGQASQSVLDIALAQKGVDTEIPLRNTRVKSRCADKRKERGSILLHGLPVVKSW